MKIIGLMIVGAGEAERFLEKALESMNRLADDALIVLNNVDEKTRLMVKRYKFMSYVDNREWGKEQWRIKEAACHKMASMGPDWVLPLDADEEFCDALTRPELEKLCSGISVAWYFPFATLWDGPTLYNREATIFNVRLWKYIREHGMQFEPKPLHCGLAPRWAYHTGDYAPFYVKHYGLMDRANRLRKAQRYQVYDPKAEYKDQSYYNLLTATGKSTPFIERDFLDEVSRETAKYKQKGDKTPKTMSTSPDVAMVLRDNGTMVPIPRRDLAETLKRHKTWRVVQESVLTSREEAPVLKSPGPVAADDIPPVDPLECQDCDFVGKSPRSLTMHRSKSHKV